MNKLFIVLVFITIIAGCPKPPLQDIANAKAALESARLAGAQTYAPKEYSSAEGYITKAQIDSNRKKYADAKINALTGKQLAEISKEIALKNKGKGVEKNGAGQVATSSVFSKIGIKESSIIGKGALGEGIIIKQLKQIHFAFDDYSLSNEAQSILIENSQWLKSHPDVKIQIEGHCDERGSEAYNLALGEERAIAAKNYLTQFGIPASRMSVISYGKERPLNPAHNEKAWAENRRDEFVLTTR